MCPAFSSALAMQGEKNTEAICLTDLLGRALCFWLRRLVFLVSCAIRATEACPWACRYRNPSSAPVFAEPARALLSASSQVRLCSNDAERQGFDDNGPCPVFNGRLLDGIAQSYLPMGGYNPLCRGLAIAEAWEKLQRFEIQLGT